MRLASPSILLVSLVMLAGCVVTETAPRSASGPAVATVYVVDRGWHTEIGLAAENLSAPLAAIKQSFPGERFLTFGFGERVFFTSRRTDLFTLLRALFPSRAAILVTALRVAPAGAFGREHASCLPRRDWALHVRNSGEHPQAREHFGTCCEQAQYDYAALDAGIGTCGKSGHGVPVGVGQPTLKLAGLTVGGTAAG